MNAELRKRWATHRCGGAACTICAEYRRAMFNDEQAKLDLQRKAEAYVRQRGAILELLRDAAGGAMSKKYLKENAEVILKELGE
jgi:hypothetical protein